MKKSRNGSHSTGAVYLTIANNPSSIRLLPTEMILVFVIPGPKEPTTEQLNEVIQPLVDDLHRMYHGIVPCFCVLYFRLIHNKTGVLMDVHRFDDKQSIHGTLYLNASDLIASRKIAGLRGHLSE
jgi:hypothetical protein